MTIRPRIILGPQRQTAPPVALKSRIVSIQRSGRKHQARKGPFARLLIVLGNLELEIFNSWELVKRTLVRVQRPHKDQAAANAPQCRPGTHLSGSAPRIPSPAGPRRFSYSGLQI